MTGHRLRGTWLILLGLLSSSRVILADPAKPPETGAKAPVDFDRQIRPILSDTCFKCHGPDAAERQADLRLDLRDAALLPAESGKPAIVPGQPEESSLVKRVFSTRKSFMMPPPESNRTLTAEQRSLLRDWIAEGAKYQTHWSLTAPVRSPLPVVNDRAWPRNAIDHFILAKLESEKLRPSSQADRTTLIRRLTLDLTGLPPTPREVDAFLADRHADAYERLVDRLLNSGRYGERMALDWLDASRYADTHGYHIDSGRDMTLWRDWIIDAYNRNLPFDRFTVEQLAGDLLPNPSLSQQVASGFNRNHMINFEGGAIPEEYQTAYVIDRVNTTGTVWLGLTIGCAQCHDHKFDPLTQKEYYQLYAFFNNLPENGLDGRKGNAEPMIPVPSRAQTAALADQVSAIGNLERRINEPMATVDDQQAQWERSLRQPLAPEWVVLNPDAMTTRAGTTLEALEDRSIVARGANPDSDAYTLSGPAPRQPITAIRLETLPDASLAGNGPGRSINGNVVLTEVRFDAGAPLKIKSVYADYSQEEHPARLAIDGRKSTGWSLFPEVGKPHFLIFVLDQPLVAKEGTRLSTTLEFDSPWERHQLGKFRLSVTSAEWAPEWQKLPEKLARIIAIPDEQRTPADASALRTYYRSNVSDVCRPLNQQLTALKKAHADLEKSIPTTMVMREMSKPRDTYLLERGQYDKHGEKVVAGTPASLPPLPNDGPATRLDLARWLVDPSHPLTARVTVNRLWQTIFGTGLVETSDDFGSQGALPSHPELLDWLAVEFREGWDVKAMIRLFVTSATYQQSSFSSPEVIARDPGNRLLARGVRHRLQAEFIRDQALAVSGLLDHRVGGKSVSPYQPAGLWEELASRLDGENWTAQTYEQSRGRDLYRRTMYTFWKRTSPPPTLVTFDAPDRETCTVRRSRTNTPLQALVLMNDPTYVEASRKLAERMILEGGSTPESRINFAFRLATARRPTAAELEVLSELFEAQRSAFRHDVEAALKLLGVGESRRNGDLDVPELAAWSMVASAILNLDETVTKG
ncbi:Planctomycete cytochrome C [Singulisphaera sp. GP187]|uniref:PSD1 and planctomycete cytochrome C domain-containing protein n=1 Tax=Singulisphaera sp. GP187 TaxID=1882752 RepID=UPI0009285B1C|nr:PSD1 and planctomycete cytochrome C domain-containing protein [Singulisphaera sp. GP187]SIO62361.1 Planctomycete cytochrome C [Singulisphaera sp. GP187]